MLIIKKQGQDNEWNKIHVVAQRHSHVCSTPKLSPPILIFAKPSTPQYVPHL